MALDTLSEKLRSKHVRTLELLQKTLDENAELREQVSKQRKVRIPSFIVSCLLIESITQGSPRLPQSNLSVERRDQLEKLKKDHSRKLEEMEQAAKLKLSEQIQACEILLASNNKLKRDLITVNDALNDAHDQLRRERQIWQEERKTLEATVAMASIPLPPESPSWVKQHQTEALIEDDELNRRLKMELELSGQALTKADARRRLTEAQLTEVRVELTQAKCEAALQREQVNALQTQLAAAQALKKSLSDEKSVRERNQSFKVRIQNEIQPFAASSKQLLEQKKLTAQLQAAKEESSKLEEENRRLQSCTATLQQQLTYEMAQRKVDATEAGIFAIHIELKRENFQLRAQVEELKALQKRFLTSAKKKSMSFPSLWRAVFMILKENIIPLFNFLHACIQCCC